MIRWKTKDGREIKYKDIEDRHLLNILKSIEKWSREGVQTRLNMGYGDGDYVEYYYRTAYGKEVKDHFDYIGLKREATRRGIL